MANQGAFTGLVAATTAILPTYLAGKAFSRTVVGSPFLVGKAFSRATDDFITSSFANKKPYITIKDSDGIQHQMPIRSVRAAAQARVQIDAFHERERQKEQAALRAEKAFQQKQRQTNLEKKIRLSQEKKEKNRQRELFLQERERRQIKQEKLKTLKLRRTGSVTADLWHHLKEKGTLPITQDVKTEALNQTTLKNQPISNLRVTSPFPVVDMYHYLKQRADTLNGPINKTTTLPSPAPA